jgi:hypothetical protein
MTPMRVRVQRIIDGGTLVSIIGVNDDDGGPLVIHVDQRPFQQCWDAWASGGFETPVEYEADQLVLRVALEIDESLEPMAEVAAHG